MKFVDEFREPELISRTAEEIRRLAGTERHYRIMEVCGGHTHAIYRFGLKDILPENIELIHGPGCPVCVLPMGRIDDGLSIAQQPRCNLRRLRRHDARSRNPGQPARTQSPRDGRSHRLFAVRCAEACAPQSRQARHVLRHRLRDHGALDCAHADAGQGRRHRQFLGVLQSRHHHPRDPRDSRFARHATRCFHRSRTCLDRDRLPSLRVDRQRSAQANRCLRLRAARTCCNPSSCCCAS